MWVQRWKQRHGCRFSLAGLSRSSAVQAEGLATAVAFASDTSKLLRFLEASPNSLRQRSLDSFHVPKEFARQLKIALPEDGFVYHSHEPSVLELAMLTTAPDVFDRILSHFHFDVHASHLQMNVAILRGRPYVECLLVRKAQADMTQDSSIYATPLECAAKFSKHSIAELLIQHGARKGDPATESVANGDLAMLVLILESPVQQFRPQGSYARPPALPQKLVVVGLVFQSHLC